MTRLTLSDGDVYVHIDDHKHNRLTFYAIMQWGISLIPSNTRKRVWRSTIEVIPLRYFSGVVSVPTSRGKKNEPVAKTDGFIGFVNITLMDGELESVDKEMSDKKVISSMPGHIDYLMELGKVTFNWVNGSVNVTLTVLDGEMSGYACSAFSDSVIEALIILRLKVQNYLPEFKAIYEKGGTKRKRG